MKRIFLIAAVTLTLVSCGSNGTNDATTEGTQVTPEATSTEDATTNATVNDSTTVKSVK